ncbi:MAG: hypothetical protein USCAAHI_01263 [Beijerinckiaceae bacterium]|nr:MAG: hypothetical protein USCAAHI_01263 [Beijerinckiaceae bacterium]
MLAIDGLAGLMSFVQAGVVEIHPWGCRADHLEQPDRLIFDLDPGEDAPWEAVIEAAKELREGVRPNRSGSAASDRVRRGRTDPAGVFHAQRSCQIRGPASADAAGINELPSE